MNASITRAKIHEFNYLESLKEKDESGWINKIAENPINLELLIDETIVAAQPKVMLLLLGF